MTSIPTSGDDLLTRLAEAEARLAATVAGLTPVEYAAASLLPGWTRGHVVGHLVLNAEGLAGAVAGVVAGVPRTMYASPEARDADIDTFAAGDLADAADRLGAAVTALRHALDGLDPGSADTLVERTPGSERTFPARLVPAMRLREVEIHHADLGSAYTRADWPVDFAVDLVDARARQAGDGPGFAAHATDLGRTWQCGGTSPVVSGTAADLGWWLTGRGSGDGLTCDTGALPGMETW